MYFAIKMWKPECDIIMWTFLMDPCQSVWWIYDESSSNNVLKMPLSLSLSLSFFVYIFNCVFVFGYLHVRHLWTFCLWGPCTFTFSKIWHVMGLFRAFLLQSYEWMDGWMGWKSLCGAIYRAPLWGANKSYKAMAVMMIVFAVSQVYHFHQVFFQIFPQVYYFGQVPLSGQVRPVNWLRGKTSSTTAFW